MNDTFHRPDVVVNMGDLQKDLLDEKGLWCDYETQATVSALHEWCETNGFVAGE